MNRRLSPLLLLHAWAWLAWSPAFGQPIYVQSLSGTPIQLERPRQDDVLRVDPDTRTLEIQTQSGIVTASSQANPDLNPEAAESGAKNAGCKVDFTEYKDFLAPTGPQPLPSHPSASGEHPSKPVKEPPTPLEQISSTLSGASTAAEKARGEELVRQALAQYDSFAQAAAHDQIYLDDQYRTLDAATLDQHLARAERSLDEAASALSVALPATNAGELARARNMLLNARDQASLGRAALVARDQKRSDDSPFESAFGQSAAAMSSDALARRTILFNGLPKTEQAKASAQLKLAEKQQITLASGQKRELTLLHNGSGEKPGMDCASFVSSALPAEVRKGHFTTLDYRAMWIAQKRGALPKPPNWSKEREAHVLDTAKAFLAIDLYRGEPLLPGDLLVYRLPWSPQGQIFLVKDYDRKAMVARIVEAAQSNGPLRERDFPMSLEPPASPKRFVRPGFLALRLKPQETTVCKFNDSAPRSASEQTSSPGRGVAR